MILRKYRTRVLELLKLGIYMGISINLNKLCIHKAYCPFVQLCRSFCSRLLDSRFHGILYLWKCSLNKAVESKYAVCQWWPYFCCDAISLIGFGYIYVSVLESSFHEKEKRERERETWVYVCQQLIVTFLIIFPWIQIQPRRIGTMSNPTWSVS